LKINLKNIPVNSPASGGSVYQTASRQLLAGFYFMQKICGIYKITSPSKKVYIGQSINILQRWNSYKIFFNNIKQQQRLYASFLKYGVDKHKFEILQTCNPEQLNELEKYYVDLFQTFNSKHGLNLRDGGGGRGKVSEETKQKISQSKLGKKFTEEHKEKLRHPKKKKNRKTPIYKRKRYELLSKNTSWNKGLTAQNNESVRQQSEKLKLYFRLNAEARERSRLGKLGKKLSKETREKMSRAKLGQKRTKNI